MNTLLKYHRFIVKMIQIVPLIIALASSTTAFAATTPASDISVKIVANRGWVRMGQNITYTVTVTNHGPDDAFFVDVVHGLPRQLQLVSLTCDQGTSPDTPNCEYSSLKSGETAVSILVATPTAAPKRGRNLKVTASISFESVDTFDPNLRNNRASVSTIFIGKLKHP